MRKIHSLVELIYNPKTDQYDVLRDEWAWYEGLLALASGTPTREWTNWAFYNDGTEAGSTIIGSANTNPTLNTDTIYLFRAGYHETAGNTWTNPNISLQYNHNGGGWNSVTTSSAPVQAADSTNLTEQQDTTQRITIFTFASNNDSVSEDGNRSALRPDPNNDGAEVLYAFQIPSGEVTDSDTIELRLWDEANSDTLDVVNQTNPTITVSEAAGISIPVVMNHLRNQGIS